MRYDTPSAIQAGNIALNDPQSYTVYRERLFALTDKPAELPTPDCDRYLQWPYPTACKRLADCKYTET